MPAREVHGAGAAHRWPAWLAGEPALRRWCWGAVGLALLLLAACFWQVQENLRLVDRAGTLAAELRGAQAAALQVLATLVDAETGQRGFLLTNDPAYLEPYETARDRLGGTFAELARSLAGAGLDGFQADRLHAMADARVALIDRSVALARAGQVDAAIGLVRGGQGKRQMDAIRAEVTRLRNTLAVAMRVDAPRLWPRGVIAGAGALAALLLVLAAWLQRAARRAAARRQAAMARFARAFGLAQGMLRQRDGRILFWDGGAERLYGYARTEALGRISHELLATTFPAPLAEIEAALAATGVWQGELTHRHKSGASVVVASHWALHRGAGGEPDVVIEVNNDITALKQSEAALRDSEARLSTIVETVPVGLVMAELPSGRIVGGNSYVETLLRHPVLPSRDIDSYDEWVAYHADGTRVAGHEYPLARMVLAGEEAPSIEVHYQRGDGTRAWVRIMGRPVRNAAGTIVGGVVALVDVDGERSAREAAARSEARLRSVIQAMPTMLWEADATGKVVWLSDSWSRYCGADEARLVGDGWFATIHPDEFQDCEAAWRAAVRAGTGYALRRRIRRAEDGAWRWHLVQAQPTHGPDGAVLRWVGSATDVHDLVEAQTALHERETMLKLFIDRAPAAIAMFDLDMRYLAVSRRFARDYRLTAEPADLPGRSHYEVFPEIPDHWRALHRRVLAGETLAAEEPFLRDDGATDWVRWEMVPWRREDGAFGGAMLFSEIVTDRVEGARALALSEARFRAAVQAVNGILWTNNAKGEMAEEQPGWAALTGQTFAEYRGHGWSRAVHPDDAGPTLAAWHAAVAEQRPFVFAHRVRRHDGVWRQFSVRALPVANPDGTLREWVGVHTDITEQREAEAVLARDKDELERLVRERTADLQQTRERLVHAQRMEALGRLAGGIAHDFNNVLQAVDGGAQLLERNAGEADKIRKRVRMITDAVARGAAITRRLLAFARRGDLRAEPIDAAALLEGIREILAHTLGAAIEVRLDVAADLPPLLADRGQVETVLVNLATNARDAMPGGGVLTLSARAADGVGDLPPGHYVRLLVADTGEGMPPEVLARAAEPFFTTKPQDKGTGLGLAMAKGFAEQSGGALGIESAVGVGTTISLWLPIAGSGAPPTCARREERPEGTRRGRLLVVDDDELVREVTAEQLDLSGYAVRTAESGAAALALLDAGEAVDLIVSDLSMPGMNGIALIEAAQRRRPELPAILLTGFAGNAAELAIGATLRNTVLLRKPVSAETLAERADMLLRAASRAGR